MYKKLIFLKSFLVILSILILLLVTPGCTTIEIPEEVCTYGMMTCDAGTFICENYELPPAVCDYFSIACTSLEVLCSVDYGSPEYNTALKNLNDANISLNKFVSDQNAANTEK